MNIWGIHMGAHVGSAPIDDGYVAIGWEAMGDLQSIEPNRNAFKKRYAEIYPSAKDGAIRAKAGVLYRFANEISEGDIVIYPSKSDRMVNIGRFEGGYEYVIEDAHEYPNHHKVNWIGHFPRDEFPQAALNQIGSAITLFSVSTYSKVFLDRVKLENNLDITNTQEPIDSPDSGADITDDETAIDVVARQAVEATSDFIIKTIKNKLDPYEFEHFVAHILECMGYRTRVSAKSGDGGVDVIAHKDELGFEPPIIKVQCKQTTGQNSEPEVSQLLGTLGEGEYALFVNLGSYSKPARVRERNKVELRLIDGEQLVEIVLENYQRLSPRYRTLIPLKQIHVPDLVKQK